jgi:hypothetical protein
MILLTARSCAAAPCRLFVLLVLLQLTPGISNSTDSQQMHVTYAPN